MTVTVSMGSFRSAEFAAAGGNASESAMTEVRSSRFTRRLLATIVPFHGGLPLLHSGRLDARMSQGNAEPLAMPIQRIAAHAELFSNSRHISYALADALLDLRSLVVDRRSGSCDHVAASAVLDCVWLDRAAA